MVFTRKRLESSLPQRIIEKHCLALGLIVLLGAGLRLLTLGRQSLWVDEGVSFWTANRPFTELLEQSASGFRPLFFLVLHPMVLLGGQEWLLRLPSALSGIASLLLLYLVGRELFDRRTGLIAALLLAVSPLHIWYSQEARMYALVSFFVLAALLFGLRAIRRNKWLDWLLFGVFEGLALLTETAAVWFVLAVNLSALLMVVYLYRQRWLWWFGASQAIALLIYLPAIPDLFETVEGEHTRWIPTATILTFFRGVADFAGGFMRTGLEGVLVLGLLVAALAIGSIFMWREAHFRRLAYLFLVAWLVVPLSISFFLSQEYFRPAFLSNLFSDRKSIFLTRNLITVLFPALLLFARSLVISPYRRLSLGLLVSLVLLNLAGYLGNTLPTRKEDYRQAARIVSQEAQPDDLVLTSPGFIEEPFAYYFYDPDPSGLPLDSLKDGIVSKGTGWQMGADLNGEGFWVTPASTSSSFPRLWLVTTSNTFQEADDEVLEYLEQHARLVETWQVHEVAVQLYDFSLVKGNLD